MAVLAVSTYTGIDYGLIFQRVVADVVFLIASLAFMAMGIFATMYVVEHITRWFRIVSDDDLPF